mmetsp:Transcript_53695/g.131240  ORF Transcript_53695/g.131240 Transcript_53695/m.131240 type:complete len:455 (-) Transcript_53695:1064-2428(-)
MLGPDVLGLALRDLARRELPGHRQSILEELDVHVKPERAHVQAKEVPVHTLANRCIPRDSNVRRRSLAKSSDLVLLRGLGILHDVDEIKHVRRVAADRLRAALIEEPHGGGFVRQARLALVPLPSELQAHLDPRIGRHLLLLDEPLAISTLLRRVAVHDEVKVVAKALGVLDRAPDARLEVIGEVELQPPRLGLLAGSGGLALKRLSLRHLDVTLGVIALAIVLVAKDPLPGVCDDRGVGPRVLGMHGSLAVGKDDEIERLVEPPRGALTVQAEVASLCPGLGSAIVEVHDEHSVLDLVQRDLVEALFEVVLPDLSPAGAVESGEGRQASLRAVGRRCLEARGFVFREANDGVELLLELVGAHGGVRVVVDDVDPPERALVQNGNVHGIPRVKVYGRVRVAPREASRREDALVLAHADGNDPADRHGRELLGIELELEVGIVVDERGRTSCLHP